MTARIFPTLTITPAIASNTNDFVASGHFKRLEELSHGVRGSFSTADNAMHCKRLSDDDYNFMEDGASVDLTDSSGMGYDFFGHVPNHWYKGVNDFKNQQKYGIRSTCTDEPISTASKNQPLQTLRLACRVQCSPCRNWYGCWWSAHTYS